MVSIAQMYDDTKGKKVDNNVRILIALILVRASRFID